MTSKEMFRKGGSNLQYTQQVPKFLQERIKSSLPANDIDEECTYNAKEDTESDSPKNLQFNCSKYMKNRILKKCDSDNLNTELIKENDMKNTCTLDSSRKKYEPTPSGRVDYLRDFLNDSVADINNEDVEITKVKIDVNSKSNLKGAFRFHEDSAPKKRHKGLSFQYDDEDELSS